MWPLPSWWKIGVAVAVVALIAGVAGDIAYLRHQYDKYKKLSETQAVVIKGKDAQLEQWEADYKSLTAVAKVCSDATGALRADRDRRLAAAALAADTANKAADYRQRIIDAVTARERVAKVPRTCDTAVNAARKELQP